MRPIRFVAGVGVVLSALAAGCSGRPAPPPLPTYDAAAAGKAALAEFDADGNGKLDAKELARCPALAMALDRADRDGDKALTADEIAARIERWFASGTIMMDGTTLVTLDGKPLAGATVTFEPEKFLGGGFDTCRGVTNELGRASPTGSNAQFPGVYVGAYRVRISKQVGGKEILPARYNTESTLGYEVADDIPEVQSLIEFRLKSH